jgi:hypothetical protein
MGPDRTTRKTTLKTVLSACLLLLLGIGSSFAADELHLIIAPISATLSAEGFIDFDAYIYNAGKNREQVPAPYGGFNVVWRLRDVCNARPEREGTYADIGTHTVDPYVMNPGSAIRCEHLGASIQAEPGDVLEFYITIERKLKSSAVQTIRSNSIIMYRPKAGEAKDSAAK